MFYIMYKLYIIRKFYHFLESYKLTLKALSKIALKKKQTNKQKKKTTKKQTNLSSAAVCD